MKAETVSHSFSVSLVRTHVDARSRPVVLTSYEVGAYRDAVLMVWVATIEYLYSVIEGHRDKFKLIPAANQTRFERSNTYKPVGK